MLVWKNAKEKIVNQRGYTLILVLLVIVVLSISGVSIMGVTASNTKRSSGDRDHQAVYYIAEAGATLKMEEIKEVITQTYELTHVQNAYVFFANLNSRFKEIEKDPITVFQQTFGEPPIAYITISEIARNDDTRTYELVSTGNIGMRSRTVVQTFDVNWEDKNLVVEDGVLSPYVLFASERLTLSGSANIVGHVGTGSSSVSGANHVTQGYRVDTNVTDTLKMPRFPDLRNTNRSLSGNQTLSRHEDFARYNSITIGNQRKLTVNVGNEPRELQVGSFSIENHNNSILEIVGDGFLTIYVENDLDLTGRILPASSNLKVAFIVEGDVTIDARGNSEIRAFIFAPNSSINISGNTSLHGTLIARNINMGGASSAYIPLHISDVGPVFPDIGRIGEGPATLEDLLTDVSNVREQ